MLRHAPVGCVIHGPFRLDGMYACAGQHCPCGEGGLCAEGGQRCLFGRGREGKEATRPIKSKRVVFFPDPGVGFNERNNARCKRASTANSTRNVFFADPGVGFDERKQHKCKQASSANSNEEVFFADAGVGRYVPSTCFRVTAQ